jgi:polysaccharide deacetylase family protein (PEP-CTERM system associated)
MVQPSSARPAHALTVDVEDWFHGIELEEADWPSASRLHVGLDRLVGLLERHQVNATFFVLGVIAERFPHVIEDLATRGHEVACHGYNHRFVYKQEPLEFRDDLQRATRAIEAVTGKRPAGYRAPYFSIRHDSLWAFDIIAEEGFVYDSSVYPVRNDRYGIPSAPARPYEIACTDGHTLQEIPLTPLRVGRMNLPFSGGAYLRILPWWVQSLAWQRAASLGTKVVAYIHPWELDPDHPRISLRRRVAATHYARLHLSEPRLDRLLTTYRFGRIDEVFEVG